MVMVTCLPASALQDREKWPGNTTAELRFSFDMTSISTSRPRCDLDAGYSESFQEQSQVIAGDVDEKELHASTPTTPPRPQLEVVYESPRKGYIQTPGWNGTNLHPQNMDSWVRVDVPKYNAIMLSMLHLNLTGFRDSCEFATLTLYAGGTSDDDILYRCATMRKRLGPTLIENVDAIHVHFTSTSQQLSTGFRFDFSLHNDSATPQRLSKSTWNCSVPYWADFKQHFPCNLVADCAGGEHEVVCPYTTPTCGRGRISAGGMCLIYDIGPFEVPFAWKDAFSDCVLRGARLAVFNTPEKWHAVVEILRRYAFYFHGFYRLYVGLRSTPESLTDGRHVRCPLGHFTHGFLACDVSSLCWARDPTKSCSAPMMPLPPSFKCDSQVQHVPYTSVCDFRSDCSDGSDENFCLYQPCSIEEPFYCNDHQCVPLTVVCDGQLQCLNGADEELCSTNAKSEYHAPPPPAMVDYGNNGKFTVRPFNSTELQATPLCPDTHYQCPGDGYCLPVFTRCNGVYDCPGKEDESGCTSYTCAGFYRCLASRTCVHPSHVCDGVFQCPQHDDELLCDFACPENCTCYGMSFFCAGPFHAHDFPGLRYLDVRRSGVTLEEIANNTLLVHLTLADCDLYHLERNVSLPNLLSLDVSGNHLTNIDVQFLNSVPQLRYLSLAENPLFDVFLVNSVSNVPFDSLSSLILSGVTFSKIDIEILSVFPELQTLNLSDCAINHVTGEGFQSLKQLKVVDLRGNPMIHFQRGLFDRLDHLDVLHADTYKLCCPAVLPKGFNALNCHAPSDEISSCDALLNSDIYRVVLSVFAALALVGNLGSFVYRNIIHRNTHIFASDVFVSHLSVSDFLMGVYLAIIGVADRLYQHTYVWEDVAWRHSVTCQVAGFLSLLSCEVSAFVICLMTLERFLVLRFPFSPVHFTRMRANVVCCLVWLLGLLLMTIPILLHWDFYSHTGICIPLPVPSGSFAGHDYVFVIMVAMNFVLFLMVAVGQIFIYISINSNTSSSDTDCKSKDLAIAGRLISIAMTDFLCWFPIGILFLLCSSGIPIPGEVNVAMAIVVLPFNSALNPFLYTFNVVMERRRRAMEKQLRKRLTSDLVTKHVASTAQKHKCEASKSSEM